MGMVLLVWIVPSTVAKHVVAAMVDLTLLLENARPRSLLN
jgi:hypothetical protein